ncbi:hypothetical protein [Phenylobacterium sp.]|jgi:hypothetical protein|uniref:hypothetical protein n=1 Tax=Phenylobacterium sp. TaxID=1871053 RepID=UPI002E2FE0A6|nr:hypothetical protein [Phenylobacterium sp.]HEX2560903.1 hypothetical protein [Phenylobacterium sp.]
MYLLTIATLLVGVFAYWKGGPAEKICGVANVVVAALYIVCQALIAAGAELQVMLLLIDCGLALVFLALAVRYASLFLGAAMILQAAQFSLHAYYMVSERLMDAGYRTANNVISWMVLACIVVATLVSWSKRRATASAARPA